MKFALHAPARNMPEAIKKATSAEKLGFEALYFADGHMNCLDPFQAMTIAALNTERLRVGIAVTNMVYRDPTVLATSAASTNEISQGRAILGLGTGDGSVYRLNRSATRITDFEKGLRTIRDLLQGGSITVPKGKEARAERKVTLTVGKLPVPIYVSAEGPRSLRAAGKFADGVILGCGFDLGVLEWARKQIAQGANENGRNLSDIDVMPAGMIYVHKDGARARSLVRARLANRAHHNFRFTMETVPEGELAGLKRFMDGFDITKPIEERVDPDLITNYLLQRFSIAGTPQECITRLKGLAEAGVERVLLTPPNKAFDEVVAAWGRSVIPAATKL
jgi:5,10-methylenetetrahydromethanopterin reductase